MVVGPGGSGGSGGSQHGKRRGKSSTRATESSTWHESGDEQEGDNDEEDAMKTVALSSTILILLIFKFYILYKVAKCQAQTGPIKRSQLSL